jgi:hypothetical protein
MSSDDLGKKFDKEKLRTDLLPIAALEKISEVLTYGAKKYGDRNWEQGISYNRVFGAALRHLFSWSMGEERDKETGFNHLAHAACCILFLLHYVTYPKYKSFDDRPVYYE